ncbi:hypothetical protein G7Z17_g10344 [Cylindrodendrum hubeiense]|uniref:Uncharacterized protein n=1 Tax=Cylindrodendrum hubeiense TaxID=595255 RepID=A0A9P5LBB4_9HYPO|nr:hypothetical protein G7Z17_g10344 [Cylindrodendrum hubeiense]
MSGDGKDGKGGNGDKDIKELIAEMTADLPADFSTLFQSRKPLPIDIQIGVNGILDHLKYITMNLSADWTQVVDVGTVSLWAATRDGSSFELKPTVPFLKDFLKKLFESEHTSGYLSKKCKGVEVCFMWRTADQPGLEDWTPPCDDE